MDGAFAETLRVPTLGLVEYQLPLDDDLLVPAIVDGLWGQIGDAAVPVLLVVPGEKKLWQWASQSS